MFQKKHLMTTVSNSCPTKKKGKFYSFRHGMVLSSALISGGWINEALSFNQDASGNNVAASAITSETEVAGNYNGVYSGGCKDSYNCLVSSDNSPYQVYSNGLDSSFSFTNYFSGVEYTATLGSLYNRVDGGSSYTDNFDSTYGSRLNYYEGNKVLGASFSVSGNNAYLILYKNYAENAEINIDNEATAFIDSNNVTGAKLNFNNASTYLNGNIANAALIEIDNGSNILIRDNDVGFAHINNIKSSTIFDSNYAANVTIDNSIESNLNAYNNNVDNANLTNSGVVYLRGNLGVNVQLTNSQGGVIYAYGNDFKHANVINSGELHLGGCDNSIDCSSYAVAILDNSSITNDGKLFLSKEINFNNGAIENNNNIYLDSVNLKGGIINNSGNIYLLSTSSVTEVINSGELILNPCTSCAGNTLFINGNYVGNNGHVSIGSVLGGDNSLTDKLIISGAATGTTYVSVTNEGGIGAQTLEGIEIISTGSSTADAFVQRGRIVAGSYEYTLQRGTASGSDSNNWYLTSKNIDETITVNRPEPSSYATNLAAAGTMFNTRLKDRQAGRYIDPLTTSSDAETSLWLRIVGGDNEGKMSDGQSKYTANKIIYQIGGDLLETSLTGKDKLHFGVMGGYGKQSSKASNNLSGYRSKGEVSGYSAGIYSTWYQNTKNKAGIYIDSWLLYNWFDNFVKGDELVYEYYDSNGITASLESGYAFNTYSYFTEGGIENKIFITPQAQFLWSGVNADDHVEQNGTIVQGRGDNNLQSRLGVRLSMIGERHSNKNPELQNQFEPFVEFNWMSTSKKYGVQMGEDSTFIRGGSNTIELKAGFEGHINKKFSLWSNVAQQLGGDGYRDVQGTLGFKYAF